MPVNETASQLTIPAEAAIRTMQNAVKMAFRRPMTDPQRGARSAPGARGHDCPRAAGKAQESGGDSARFPLSATRAAGLSPGRIQVVFRSPEEDNFPAQCGHSARIADRMRLL